jgi:adenylate kinase family enzyme
MESQTFIFIGRSGCGKGTQVDLLKKVLEEKDPSSEIVHFETGNNFRELVSGESYTSKLAKEIYDKGNLQPDFMAISFWSDFLIKNFKGNELLIFDGICRCLSETMSFTSAMAFYNRNPIVIYVNVSRKWSKEKLLARGRADDDEKGIEKRLDWFDRDTIPAIEYFKSNERYTFLDINGEQTIEDVHKEIMEKLGWQ